MLEEEELEKELDEGQNSFLYFAARRRGSTQDIIELFSVEGTTDQTTATRSFFPSLFEYTTLSSRSRTSPAAIWTGRRLLPHLWCLCLSNCTSAGVLHRFHMWPYRQAFSIWFKCDAGRSVCHPESAPPPTTASTCIPGRRDC